MRIDVVIPVLNEASRIGAQLDRIRTLDGVGEIVVVDGGSDDATVAEVDDRPDVRLVRAPTGRARQQNAGAVACGGEVILFVHADVVLPVDALERVRACLADASVVGGAFRTHHVAESPGSWADPLLRLADLRSRYTRLPYGDQAIFVRRTVFEQVGGFPDTPVFEDLELSRRLWTMGRLEILRAEVEVSGRRFQSRPLYYAVVVNVLPLLQRVGVPTRALARLWRPVR